MLAVKLDRTLIGMVHLAPLPGSPRWSGSMTVVIDQAIRDARHLVDNGIDALLIENHGDAPFTPRRVPPSTVAAMAVIATAVRERVGPHLLGINVLKNDARAALAIATATGAEFIRVNVHAGAVLADQGIVESDAYHTLRDRRLLDADVRIFADVQSKHAVSLAPVDLERAALDLVRRGMADALVISGSATGEATSLDDLKRVRRVLPAAPLIVGSGVTPETAADLLSVADALIVGTCVKQDGDVANPVDPERVRLLAQRAR
jgi:membrane complex biogenesis BtpA family protein